MVIFIELKHGNLISGSGCMKERDMANFGRRTDILPYWPSRLGKSFFELDSLPKVEHYLELDFMILGIKFDALVVMVGRKYEKKRNQIVVEKEK